jgi:hypothetical protein
MGTYLSTGTTLLYFKNELGEIVSLHGYDTM